MAVITKIGGVATSGTSGVNNIFGSGSGGGVSAAPLGTNAGVQVFGRSLSTLNADLDSTFNRSAVGLTQYSGSDFICACVRKNSKTAAVVTNDGKLHYMTTSSAWVFDWNTDGDWHEDTASPTGTSGNWTWIDCDDQNFMAIRGGDVVFRGYGNYRQRGDGSTSSISTWVKTYDGSTDPAVKVYLNYRISYLITQSGKIYNCGYRYDGQTGEGTSSGQQASWTDITPAGITVADIGFGYRNAKIIDSLGDVYSWGDNANQHSGPLDTGTADNLSVVRSTNTQPFLGAKFFGGGSGDLFVIRTSNGEIWAQGEGGGRERPDGSTSDIKNAWTHLSSLDGVYAEPYMSHGQTNNSDNISFMTKTNGEVTINGTDASGLTASPTATGTSQSGNPPFDVLGGSQNVKFANGNYNHFIVVYGS